jgi:hypothetical protein
MFGFGKTDKDVLADPKAVGRWLAAFPANDPLAAHAEILAELTRIADPATKRTPANLAAVFRLDSETAALRRSLTNQYCEHANRSPKIEQQLWSALFDQSQAFLLAYLAFARDVANHPQSSRWQALQAELTCRQIMHLALEAKVRLFRFEPWIPTKWSESFGLFTLACSRQFDRKPIEMSAKGDVTTIEHEFVLLLVLQLMYTGNMTPRQLDWVSSELPQWCAPLHLAVEQESPTSFYVDLARREGLRRRTPAPLEGRVLFLDTRTLHATLTQNAIVMDQKIREQPLSERNQARSDQLTLVTRLAAQVDPEFRPTPRRGERLPAAGYVEAIVGFAKIAGYLREEEREPTPQPHTGTSFGGTLELATFGRMRNMPGRREDLVRQRFAAFAAPGGPWEIKDTSQTGYRLIAPMSVATTITLGTLVAMRMQGQPLWTLGIIRRMRRLTTDRAEIGLQVVANALVGVDLIEQRKNQDADYSVDGEATTVNGRGFGGLFLAFRKRDHDIATVQSLVVPAVEYQPAKRLKLLTNKGVHTIRFGRLIEEQPEWVWATIEPLGDASGMPTITPSLMPPAPAGL